MMLNDDACHSCGMITKEDREYHPYAACLLFKACGNGDTVRAELAAVKGHALNDLKNLKQAAKEQGYALVPVGSIKGVVTTMIGESDG